MRFSELHSVDIENFRSIRGHVHAPLDAKVVLIHGENGAGKTSLLSAIELALTGQISSLHRADPHYELQLLHKRASNGYVEVKVAAAGTEERFRAELAAGTVTRKGGLAEDLAEFFAERAYLPQSLLGQLLQIYQDAGSDAASPLARFVSRLLGLDKLDALEAGLKPLKDVRNVRKFVDGWSASETAKSRFESLIEDQRRTKAPLEQSIAIRRVDLLASLAALGVASPDGSPEDVVITLADGVDDEARLARLTDQLRVLSSIRRDLANAIDSGASVVEANLLEAVEKSGRTLEAWRRSYGDRTNMLRSRVGAILPQVSFSTDAAEFHAEARRLLSSEHAQLVQTTERGREDGRQLIAAQDQLNVATTQLATLDRELSAIAANSVALSSALAEMSSFIVDDNCPVCGRDYGEVAGGSLLDHVHARTRAMSSSAERLIALGRSRSAQHSSVERLRQSIESLASRQVDSEVLAAMDRRASDIGDVIVMLESLGAALQEGQQLLEIDVASRRALLDAQQRDSRRLAVRGNLEELAKTAGLDVVGEVETVEVVADKVEHALIRDRDRASGRVRHRAKAIEEIGVIRAEKLRVAEIDEQIARHQSQWDRHDVALRSAEELRSQGLKIRNAVDEVRSRIIRREFNDRLNRMWRDLFVRLAPGEEFVPAFRIPSSDTQRLQPKLYTPHRDFGDKVAGGTPGAMLSAGNLNTAALTLFVALHLSVPVQLPWLILDDPVQSMDDIHIAHFAALLRTLSKEHERQIMIAVHDRQLFEYLRLELSPAFADDSLITLELNRSARRDTQCTAYRYGFKEETALRVA